VVEGEEAGEVVVVCYEGCPDWFWGGQQFGSLRIWGSKQLTFSGIGYARHDD